jgi:dUTP pyrophosphatase
VINSRLPVELSHNFYFMAKTTPWDYWNNGVSVEASFIKTVESAQLPTQAHSEEMTGDTGFDLYSVADIVIPARGSAVVPIGLKLGFITPGFWFKIEGRSGLGFKHGIQPHFGIVDNGYRGDLGVKLYNLTDTNYQIHAGDRCAQIVFYPIVQAQLRLTDSAVESSRGETGFGKSGK